MCGGICGPAGEKLDWNSAIYRQPTKKIKQRKVPYKSHAGTVIACYEGQRLFVELYQSKNTKEWVVSWSGVLSSGASSWREKIKAVNEYNQHVPEENKI